MITARMKTAVLLGALLGIICILGAGYRMGFAGNWLMLGALWYNRFLMGIVIGLASSSTRRIALVRGAILGLLVSLAFFFTTEFADPLTFGVGLIYGIIIDYLASRHQWLARKFTEKFVTGSR